MNAAEDHLGSKLRHGSDIRRTTALAPKVEVHRRSCYVAEWDGPAVLPPYRLRELVWGFRRARGAQHHALQDRRSRCTWLA
jgi:hypothetical protein